MHASLASGEDAPHDRLPRRAADAVAEMARNLLTAERVLTLLPHAVSTLAELTAGVPPSTLRANPAPGEWSANEVLAHLRSCADVWGSAIARIVAEDHPTIRAVSPTTWIDDTDYAAQDFDESLRAFTAQRAELVALLEPLPPDDWHRSATVTGAGRPLEQTVLGYATRLTRHEQSHLGQIARVVRTLSAR